MLQIPTQGGRTAGSETESASPGSSPGAVCSRHSSSLPTRSSYTCVLEVINEPRAMTELDFAGAEQDEPLSLEVDKRTTAAPAAASPTGSSATGTTDADDPRSYVERENRRKERNNAASRKSRALRKRKFQQMLNEAEKLASSNAKLRKFLEELNSVMAEAQAILLETVGKTGAVDLTQGSCGLTASSDGDPNATAAAAAAAAAMAAQLFGASASAATTSAAAAEATAGSSRSASSCKSTSQEARE